MVKAWWIIAVSVVIFGLAFLQAWSQLDGFEWLVMPPLAFAAMLLLMRMTGKPVTSSWVGVSAAMSVLIGVFLRFY